MPDTSLLVNLALALVAAAIGGAVAVRLRQSAILGYIIAGVLIGPFTPGPVSDPETVAALADLGLVFLLFAVGLQLSLRDLLRAGRPALIGATLQVAILLAAGYLVARGLGFGELEGLFFGAFVALSSTTVLAKVLGDRGELDTRHGLLAMAWATVQDLLTIVLVVVLGGLAAVQGEGEDLALAVGKAVIFMAIALPVSYFLVPWLFKHASLLRSREVFVLSVVAVALATAFLAQAFGLSIALGAFVAGLLVSESEVSHQALGELGPLRDVFSALFFVFVGMLVNPIFVLAALPMVVVALLLLIPLKGLVVAALAGALRVPWRPAFLAGAALAQAGEFSFLLARVGVESNAVGEQMFSLMLAGAAASIVVAPWLMRAGPALLRAADRRYGVPLVFDGEPGRQGAGDRGRYVVICGFGRVGRIIGAALERRGFTYRVVDADPQVCAAVRQRGFFVVQGSAENPRVLDRADLLNASVLVVALPDSTSMRYAVDHARRANRRLPIIARARTAGDRDFLRRRDVAEIVIPETEGALEMARFTLARLGVSAPETQAIVQGLRRRTGG